MLSRSVVFAQVGEVVPADGEGFLQAVNGEVEEFLLLGLFGVGGGGFVFGDELGTARVKAGGVVTVVLVLRCPLAQLIGGWDGVGEFASFEHFDGSKHFFTGRDGSPFRLE